MSVISLSRCLQEFFARVDMKFTEELLASVEETAKQASRACSPRGM